MVHKIYRKLRKHLDKQAVGFPKTKTKAEYKLLQRFFTPEQAKLGLSMTYRFESVEIIFKRSHYSEIAKVKEILDIMVLGRGIYWKNQNKTDLYALAPLIVGFYELSVGMLTPDYLKELEEYTDTTEFALSMISTELSQMRTIPIENVVPPQKIIPYDDVQKLVEDSTGKFAVVECICRQKHRLEGDPCEQTDRKETCLAMGGTAQQAIKLNLGRELTASETLEILRKNAADGLIFQPSGGEEPEFICSCCECCCGMLRFHHKIPRPAEFWTHDYHAEVDESACIGCGICVKACNVHAISMQDGKCTIDLQRCLGCGHCTTHCRSDAISLVQNAELQKLPKTHEDFLDYLKKYRPNKVKLLIKGLRMKMGRKWHYPHKH